MEKEIPIKDLYLGELVKLEKKQTKKGGLYYKKYWLGYLPFIKYQDENGAIYGEYACAICGPERYYERKLYRVEPYVQNLSMTVNCYQNLAVSQKHPDYVEAAPLTTTNFGLPTEKQKVEVDKFIVNAVKLFPHKQGVLTEEELAKAMILFNKPMIEQFNYRYTGYKEEISRQQESGKQLSLTNKK